MVSGHPYSPLNGLKYSFRLILSKTSLGTSAFGGKGIGGAGLVASQCGPGAYANKYVIVVDDDIDPSNIYDVLWAVGTRSDPATSIDIIKRTYTSKADPIYDAKYEYEKYLYGKDPIIGGTDKAGRWVNCPGSVAIIDACIPFELKEFFPESCEPSEETKRKVMDKWPELFS